MRVYKRKSERATHSQEVYDLAAAEVLEKKCSIRKASQTFGLCHVSLYRYAYIKKKKNNERLRVGYVKPRQVLFYYSNNRRKRKSTVLTATPEKEALQKEHDEKMKKKQKKDDEIKEKGKGKGKGKGKSTKNKTGVDRARRKVLCSDSESESEEWFCLVCSEAYTNSNKEDWVECILCKMWAHVGCVTGDTISFICINCSSDED